MSPGKTMTPRADLSIELIVFDLGGVLVELAGVERMMELTGRTLSLPELWRRWMTSPAVREFESGRLAEDDFASRLIAEFALPMDVAGLQREFAAWVKGPFPDVPATVERLARSFKLAILSNTNRLHWKKIADDMGFVRHFHYAFVSCETGRFKPDADAYLHVLRTTGCSAARALYLDDQQVNVDGALAVGMQARRVVGFDGACRALAALGLAW
jgi:putative hydrolase of the HAD superfamily